MALAARATRTKIRSRLFHIASEQDLLRLKKIAKARRSSPADAQDIAFLVSRRDEGRARAQFALRWILMFDAASCAIPGAKTPAQARDNAGAADLPPLDDASMAAVRAVYDERLRPLVHASW